MVKDEHEHVLWERRVDAMMMLLTHPSRRLLVLDELRRNIEALGPGAYETMGYYERWVAAIANAMIDRGRGDERRPGPPHGGGRGAPPRAAP